MSLFKPAIISLIWAFVSLSLIYGQNDDAFVDVLAAHPSVLLNDLTDYELVRLDDQTRAIAALSANRRESFSLETGGRPLTFQLSPLEMRSPNYHRITTAGSLVSPPTPTTQFRGTVEGSGEAIFTIAPTFLMGQWELNGQTYLLEPLWFSAPGAPHDVYVSYRASDLRLPVYECGVTKHHPESAEEGITTADKNSPGFKIVSVAVVVDSLFYRKFSDDEEAENYFLGLLALVQGDYDKGFSGRIRFQLTTLLLSRGGSHEGWSAAIAPKILLENFRNFGNSPAFDEDYDVATLMTGRDLYQNVIGIAYLDAMCDTNRYNIVQKWYPGTLGQRAIWSHELGHNLGARHTSEGRFIMSPTSDQNDDRWASSSVSAIESHLERYACLEPFGWQYLRLTILPGGVRLNWEFADENPHDGFLIQRATSPDGPWTDVSRVPDFSSDEFLQTDTDLAYGQVYYYRVIQFSTDGTPCISETRKINVSYLDRGRLSPNPTFAKVRVYSPGIEARNYKLYDAMGRLLWPGTITQGSNLIDLSDLPAGVYIFVEEGPKGELTLERIVKQ